MIIRTYFYFFLIKRYLFNSASDQVWYGKECFGNFEGYLRSEAKKYNNYLRNYCYLYINNINYPSHDINIYDIASPGEGL